MMTGHEEIFRSEVQSIGEGRIIFAKAFSFKVYSNETYICSHLVWKNTVAYQWNVSVQYSVSNKTGHSAYKNW